MNYNFLFNKTICMTLFFIASIMSINVAEKEFHLNTDDEQDYGVNIYAKVVWDMTIDFICGDSCIVTYHVHSDPGVKDIFVERVAPSTFYSNTYIMSSDDLRMMSLKDKNFKKIMTHINADFFNVSNKSKVIMIEEYINKQCQPRCNN